MTRSSRVLSPFAEQIKTALKHFHNAEWLGLNSPLAAPYFFRIQNEYQKAATVERGKKLQERLEKAARLICGDGVPHSREQLSRRLDIELSDGHYGPNYAYALLDITYFRRYFRPKQLNHIYKGENKLLPISRAKYYRDLDEAIGQLSDIFLELHRPNLRLEQPILRRSVIGREDECARCLIALQANKIVMVQGAVGVGKTTLGAAVASKWSSDAVFWLTLRRDINDQLNSFLFELAYFLHQHRCSSLWQHIAGSESMIDPSLALGLIRYDIGHLTSARPLLCFDEIDVLIPNGYDKNEKGHTNLLTFIEGLQGLFPMLLLGQRSVPYESETVQLTGLSPKGTAKLLSDAGVPFTQNDLDKLYRYTEGNPLVLELCIGSYPNLKSWRAVLHQLPETPATDLLFDRVWRWRTGNEQKFLQTLSVFRQPVPRDALRVYEPELQTLLAVQMITESQNSGIEIIHALKQIVLARLSAELKDTLHLEAARIRSSRGEYTAAAFHYNKAGLPDRAISEWYQHRHREIQRGQAADAHALFSQLSLHRVNGESREQLAMIRAELHRRAGSLNDALSELDAVTWEQDRDSGINGILMRGDILDLLNDAQATGEQYETGLEAITRLMRKLMSVRLRQATLGVRQGNLQKAIQEARRAQYDYKRLQGIVHDEQGHYATAQTHHRVALALAEELGDVRGLAQTYFDLAILHSRQKNIDLAATHFKHVIDVYASSGDRMMLEATRINLAGMFVQAERYSEVIPIATEALAFFTQLNSTYYMAVACTNLAEAYFGLENWEKARHFAARALALEEPSSLPFAFYVLGRVEAIQGDYRLAEQYLLRGQSAAQGNTNRYMDAYISLELGKTWSASGEGGKSAESLRHAIRLFEEFGLDKERKEAQSILRNPQKFVPPTQIKDNNDQRRRV